MVSDLTDCAPRDDSIVTDTGDSAAHKEYRRKLAERPAKEAFRSHLVRVYEQEQPSTDDEIKAVVHIWIGQYAHSYNTHWAVLLTVGDRRAVAIEAFGELKRNGPDLEEGEMDVDGDDGHVFDELIEDISKWKILG